MKPKDTHHIGQPIHLISVTSKNRLRLPKAICDRIPWLEGDVELDCLGVAVDVGRVELHGPARLHELIENLELIDKRDEETLEIVDARYSSIHISGEDRRLSYSSFLRIHLADQTAAGEFVATTSFSGEYLSLMTPTFFRGLARKMTSHSDLSNLP